MSWAQEDQKEPPKDLKIDSISLVLLCIHNITGNYNDRKSGLRKNGGKKATTH